MSSSQLQEHVELLLRLPRELRDLIYPNIVTSPSPIPLAFPDPHPITLPENSCPTIAAEALESYYQHNTFIVDLNRVPHHISPKRWGPHSIALSHIRHLIVLASEETRVYQPRNDISEFEQKHWDSPERRRWKQLFSLPKLSSLTINLSKQYDRGFYCMDFGPVLYELRERHPGLEMQFSVSFDEILEEAWDEPVWSTFPLYQPSGFIDVSNLIASPTEEDRKYVEDYLPHRTMPAGRSVKDGLLAESATQRRALGQHYVVKEPPLLRVLMEEHFKVYTELEKERRARGEGQGLEDEKNANV